MKGASRLLEHGPSGARSPGHRRSPGRKAGRPFSLERRRSPRGAVRARRGLEVKVPLVEPFTRPVLRDFAQDVMDAHLAQVDPDEMA